LWPWKKRKNKEELTNRDEIIAASIDDIKNAVNEFASQAPKGVQANVLVKEDHSIDFHLLKPYLKGIPNQKFYMSKETYEIFKEEKKDIPKYMDLVQQAVDKFVNAENALPIIDGDPYRKVSYYKLESVSLLKQRPPVDFYITKQENLVSHKKPEK
jgi:hypothetical protein